MHKGQRSAISPPDTHWTEDRWAQRQLPYGDENRNHPLFESNRDVRSFLFLATVLTAIRHIVTGHVTVLCLSGMNTTNFVSSDCIFCSVVKLLAPELFF